MSQTGQEYVCNGAICRCDKGTLPSQLRVLANQTVHLQGKTLATTLDKLFMPCVPMLTMWEDYFDKESLVAPGCHPLLEKSTIRCALGGKVSIISTLQIAMPLPPPPPQVESARTSSMSLCPVLVNDFPPRSS
jgi:hypothetical protein